MTSYKDKMAQKTGGMRTVTDIRKQVEAATNVVASPAAPKPGATPGAKPESKNKTAPGLMGELAAANQKIEELTLELAQGGRIAVSLTIPNPYQPRRLFDPIELDELSTSISTLGQIQPIAVRLSPTKPGFYEIIVGERRVRALKLLGQEHVKAVIVELNDAEMALWALAENMDRTDLSDFEICKAARQVETMFNTRKELAASLGKSRSHLYRYFSFEKLPEWVLDDLEQNPRLISCSTAEDITKLLNSYEQADAIFKDLWTELKEKEVEQSKLGKMLSLRLQAKTRPGSDTSSVKLFKGGKSAGVIKKDGKKLKIEIQSKYLSADQEEKIRATITELFS